MLKQCTVGAMLAGIGACAVLTFGPIAGAEEPPCEQRPPDQQQQCQQDPGAGVVNQVGDALHQGQQAVKPFIDPKTGKPNPGPTGLRVLINGVDTCLPVGVPAPLGADVRVVPGDPTGACILGP